jgi:predicted permease
MWVSTWWLDLKLGLRNLVRYQGLTLVGGLAIAVAIGIGTAYFEFAHDFLDSPLPLAEGERVVGIQNWDRASAAPQGRTLHDFVMWREQLTTVRDLGAYTTGRRNLITDDGRSEAISVTEITASGFHVARVPALLGRQLFESDQQAGAPPVVVIGYELWQTRFAGDRSVVGRTVRLGAARATVVGVMPDGFAFPVRSRLWTPLQVNVIGVPRLEGPSIVVFGRLAPGVDIEQAQAELTTLGLRAAADFPATNERLRPRIVQYTQLFVPSAARWQLRLIGLGIVMLLVVACANVATLIYARTATREGEIAVRYVLGATAGRIVTQLFAEALVLSLVAALVGVVGAAWALQWVMGVFWEVQGPDGRPFWWSDQISGDTILYVALLTVAGAAIAGVLPASKVIGKRVQSDLVRAGARGASLRFGGMWTVIIVTQVALTVAFLPTAVSEMREAVGYQAGDVGVPAEAFLTTRLEMELETLPGAPPGTEADLDARFTTAYRELERRLSSEPGVVAVTFGDRLPGMGHPGRNIEVEDLVPADSIAGLIARVASVDVDFFDALDIPALSGRVFDAGDLESEQPVVLVNSSFVQNVLGNRNPLGRRVRYASVAGGEPGAWHEIVGVVSDLGMNPSGREEGEGLYHPMAPQASSPVLMAVRVAGQRPESLGPRLGMIAAAVDPTLRLYDVQRLDEAGRTDHVADRLVASTLLVVGAIALLLSAVGLHALTSFTVSQRTREIGIRVALGADHRRILIDIFSRVLVQLTIGVAVGGVAAVLLLLAGLGDQISREGPALLLMVGVVMLGVGILACVAPARRVLRIQPKQALSET